MWRTRRYCAIVFQVEIMMFEDPEEALEYFSQIDDVNIWCAMFAEENIKDFPMSRDFVLKPLTSDAFALA